MFDIGWSEMAVIAMIALIVIGPKDLPNTMKTIAQWMRKAKSLTREFQSGFDEMVREAELEDAKKALESTRRGNLERTISNAIDPDDEVGGEVRDIERQARHDDSSSASSTKTDTGKGGDGNAGQAAAKTPPAKPASTQSVTPPSTGDTSDGGTGGGNGDGTASASGSEGSKQSA